VTGANSGGVDAPADEMLCGQNPQPSSVYPQEEDFFYPQTSLKVADDAVDKLKCVVKETTCPHPVLP
jgi:hypothetical protein